MIHITEDCLGEFGFRVVWKVLPHWADVRVYEITSREDGTPGFDRRGARSLPDPVHDITDAEVYLKGYIKWDGCSELDQGCPHWCGPIYYKKHIALLEWLYKRAQELMEAGNWSPWDE